MEPTTNETAPATTPEGNRIATLEAQVAGLQDDLRAVLATIRPMAAPVPATATAAAPVAQTAPAAKSTSLMGRRKALTAIAGVAVAGATGAAILGDATPAAAITATYLELNNAANASQAQTQVVTNAGGAKVKSGFGVTDNTASVANSASALVGHAKGGAFDVAISAIGEGPAGGLSVHTADGTAASFFAETNTTAAISTVNAGPGYGIDIDTIGTQIHFGTQPESPLFEGRFSSVGELRAAQDDSLWFCTQTGTPGLWRKVAGPKTAGSLHVLPAPIRVYDSRPGTQPNVGPKTVLTPNSTRVVDIKANNSTVPFAATAVMVTVLLVNAAVGNGNFTIWANTVPKPLSNTVVWGGDAQRFTASTTTAVGPNGFVQVNASNTTDLVLDVVGFYL